MNIQLCAVEGRQEALQLVEASDDLVNLGFDDVLDDLDGRRQRSGAVTSPRTVRAYRVALGLVVEPAVPISVLDTAEGASPTAVRYK